MKQKQQHPESPDKGAASGDPKTETPMQKFKGLTRQLLGVSRRQLQTELERYRENKRDEK